MCIEVLKSKTAKKWNEDDKLFLMNHFTAFQRSYKGKVKMDLPNEKPILNEAQDGKLTTQNISKTYLSSYSLFTSTKVLKRPWKLSNEKIANGTNPKIEK